jgi:AcrR family transcriptional regulator
MSDDQDSPPASGTAAEQRRVAMLRAALEVIAERGFPDTRIADVAERAGTSPALVIYYFRNKDNLLTEAMRLAEDLWYDLGARRMETLASAAARLEEIVSMTFLAEGDDELPDSWKLWLDLWAQSVHHPEVARVREEFDSHWRETIADIVRGGQASGEFIELDATEFAITLSALLDGLAIQIALYDPVVDPQRAFRATMRFASQTLGFPWKQSPVVQLAARTRQRQASR